MLTVYTGRNSVLEGALIEAVRASAAKSRMVIVPRQLTLQTEQILLDKLGLEGAFDLQVLSTERLCARLFEAAGLPEGEKVDERGRVMLARAALREAGARLTVYRGAEKRRGFPETAATQLERLRQAHMTPDQLHSWAEELGGTAAMKLHDLAVILEKYEELTQGRYLDGETEFQAAIDRVEQVAFLPETALWFYGYDLVPPTLYELIAALCGQAAEAGLFLPLENDPDAPDRDCYLPLEKALGRLQAIVRSFGGSMRRVPVAASDADDRHDDIKTLERALFAWPGVNTGRAPEAITLLQPRTVKEECQYAAALSRHVAHEQGWRWNDIQLLVADPEIYAEPLRAAFSERGIPLVLASSRSAARFPVVECLTTSIRLLARGYPQQDMLALLGTGFLPITRDEADRYANFIVRLGLRGAMFTRRLKRGTEAERASLEPIRAKVAAPLLALHEELRQARTLPDQMAALFHYLERLNAVGKLEERIAQLIALGERERASEVSQVWNRVLGAMDQMVALLGSERLPLDEVMMTLSASLSASPIKALPQSGDAVYAQGMNSACSRPARLLMILGLSDQPAGSAASLLTEEQTRSLSAISGRYLGPDERDLSRMRRYYLKASLGMATHRVVLSCPLSSVDGTAQTPSAVFELVREIFPAARSKEKRDKKCAELLLRNFARPALTLAAQGLAQAAEGEPLRKADRAAINALRRQSDRDEAIGRAMKAIQLALDGTRIADRIHPATAQRLYRDIQKQSVTSLEQVARCPFAYFVQYGLRPERTEPYAYRAGDEGTFLHEAVRQFMLESRQDLHILSAEQAEARMGVIAARLLEEAVQNSALGDTAATRAESRRLMATAQTCAVQLARQMHGSDFENKLLESAFGPEDGPAALHLADGSVLQGKIDRVDAWQSDHAGDGPREYLRVIDYKRGGKAMKLAETWQGLSFQLPVYLAAAMRKSGALSAGVYYFPLTEGICATQSGDPSQVDRERVKLFRMQGLLPKDRALREAISPQLSDVLNVRLKGEGELYSGTLSASEQDYEALIRYALKQAEERSREIRSGHCAISPARTQDMNACTWCDHRSICLFDDRLDAHLIRKFPKVKEADALEAILQAENADRSVD